MTEKTFTQTDIDIAYASGALQGIIQSNLVVEYGLRIIDAAVELANGFLDAGIRFDRGIALELVAASLKTAVLND